MKRSLLLLMAIVFSLFAVAQEDKEEEKKPDAGDVIVEDEEGGSFYYESYDDYKDRKNKHWQGLDIGINGLSFEDGTDVPPSNYKYMQVDYGRSFYFGVNLFEVGVPLNGELIKIVSGLGFDFNNIQLKNNYLLISESDTLSAVYDSVRSYRNNNLKNSHLTVPLLLGFNTSPKNSTSFHFAVGAIFSYRLNGKQKIQFEEHGIKQKLTRKDRMHQNPWRVTGTVRLGYANFHVFGNYTLTEFFESGEGPVANLWSVGVKVLPW